MDPISGLKRGEAVEIASDVYLESWALTFDPGIEQVPGGYGGRPSFHMQVRPSEATFAFTIAGVGEGRDIVAKIFDQWFDMMGDAWRHADGYTVLVVGIELRSAARSLRLEVELSLGVDSHCPKRPALPAGLRELPDALGQIAGPDRFTLPEGI